MASGEDKVWETLAGLIPEEVCRRTGATFYAASGMYQLHCFGREVLVSPGQRTIASRSAEGEGLIGKLGFFLRFSALGYLAGAREVAPSGRLIKPEGMKSGQLFFRGAHALPLDDVAERFGSDREGFLRKGARLNGEVASYGDAAVTLFPLPRTPVTIILWLRDEEFPARADLLFDAASELQLPIDTVWAVAMLTVTALLTPE
ncbi:MAG: DUF3786 domain-containing protein [Nitrospirota bacterium]